MPIKAEDRAELERLGRWEDFRYRREALKETMSAQDALAQSLSEYLPGESETPFPKSLLAPSADSLDKPKYDTSDLAQKSKPAECFQWVASNLRDEVHMGDCPGRDAFSLLMDCLSSPAFRREFWKTMYTKIVPSRGQLGDDDDSTEIDGAMALAVLGKIGDIAQAAQAVLAVKEAECEAS